jgi:hypothetical protein
MVIAKTCSIREKFTVPDVADLCKEVSTKGKDNAAASGVGGSHLRAIELAFR